MSNSIIGLFDTSAEAASAREQLISAGIPDSSIRISSTSSGPSHAVVTEDKGFWESLKEMFGADEPAHAGYYAEGARRGGVVLKVDADDAEADRAAEILHEAGAVDVDAKAAEWRGSGWSDESAYATASDTATAPSTSVASTTAASAPIASADAASKIDIVKEDLAVGKRVVNRGGVRIVKRIIERPVEEDVVLREERVSVDRRAVDRPVHGVDANDAFKEQSFELRETGEEVVASKTARVVGEVVVGKKVDERTEKVRDTVRETDVNVEKLPGQVTTSTSKTIDAPDRDAAQRTPASGV